MSLISECSVILYEISTKCEVKMSGYWSSSLLACLRAKTESRSLNFQEKNKVNIHASRLDQRSFINKGCIIYRYMD